MEHACKLQVVGADGTRGKLRLQLEGRRNRNVKSCQTLGVYMVGVLGLGLGAGLGAAPVWAEEGLQIVPEREREIAAQHHAQGPTSNKGVKAVAALGSVDLGKEFPGMEGRALRAREIVIDPGGVVAVHQHDARPGLAYILDGEIVEHRSDSERPLVRRAGDVAFENSGITHWWENTTEKPVRALVVDVVPAEKK